MNDETTSNPTPEEGADNSLEIYDYTHLRRFIGILAISIGIITVFLADDPRLSSISASYWYGEIINLIAARDFFVGGLCVVSAFLLAYRGRGKWEPRLSKVACLAAALVAFFPTAQDKCKDCGIEVHGVAAFVLFAILLVFIWGFANRAKQKGRHGRKWFYLFFAGLLGLFLAVGAVAIVTQDHAERVLSRIIYWVEFGALGSFGIAWLWAGYYERWDQYLQSRQNKESHA